MPQPTGSIIEPDEPNGKPAIDADRGASDRIADAGSGTAGGTQFEEPYTEFISGPGDDGRTPGGSATGGKRRGRPPGSKNTARSSDTFLSLEDAIYNLHNLAAVIVAPLTAIDAETLALSKEEAKQLSNAVKEVGKHYNAVFDPKKVAIGNLVVTAGGIYGLRLFAIWNSRKVTPKAKVETAKPTPINTRPNPTPKTDAPAGLASPSDIFGQQEASL